jgi:hypothetical protein
VAVIAVSSLGDCPNFHVEFESHGPKMRRVHARPDATYVVNHHSGGNLAVVKFERDSMSALSAAVWSGENGAIPRHRSNASSPDPASRPRNRLVFAFESFCQRFQVEVPL